MEEIKVVEYVHELFVQLTADLEKIRDNLKAEPECPFTEGEILLVRESNQGPWVPIVFEGMKGRHYRDEKGGLWDNPISLEMWKKAGAPYDGPVEVG